VSPRIHPSAIVEDGARLGDDAEIGPFCRVGGEAVVGARARLVSHVVVMGRARIGAGTQIFPFAVVGAPSQDLKTQGHDGALKIGDDCIIREGVTINGGTPGEHGTRIGRGCALLAYSHVAHDCRLGDHVTLSNNVLLGGHVEIGDHAMVGGGTAVHQFVRIGAHAFVAGLSGLEGDVAPYCLAGGNRAHLFGLNLVGLRRRGFDEQRIAGLRAAYRLVFAKGAPLDARLEAAEAATDDTADVKTFLDFLRAPSQRPRCAPRAGADDATIDGT